MKLTEWGDLELEQTGKYRLPFPVRFTKVEKEMGYCPVFNTYTDALEYAGDANLVKEVELSFVKALVD